MVVTGVNETCGKEFYIHVTVLHRNRFLFK